VLYYFAAGRIQSRLENDFVVGPVFSNVRIEELVSGLVAGEQDQAPDEVGKKSADQDNDQDGQSLPQFRRATLQCQRLDRIARGQTVGETSTHDAGKQGNSDALTQVKFPNRRFLLLGRHDAIFWKFLPDPPP